MPAFIIHIHLSTESSHDDQSPEEFEKELSEYIRSKFPSVKWTNVKVIARYPNGNPFKSGRLIGDHILHNKPALVEVGYGEGRIILFGFRPQNRAQTHGTFMLFFNSLYYGSAKTDSK